MKYSSSNLAIITPSINYHNIKIFLNSIKNQTKKPGQTIIVFNRKQNFKSNKKIIFSYINKSNQVCQRNHGLNLINKKIKLILQLDDKFYLDKYAIEHLINLWNSVDKDVAGIGIKSKIENKSKIHMFNILKNFILRESNASGKVLKNGLNNQFTSRKKIYNVDWLQGGLSSWRLESVPQIFNRKFPTIKWSVFEDLIFSYDVKFNKKLKLLMCNKIKAKMIDKNFFLFTINEHFYRGFEYARMHKVFVYLNKDKLSKLAFFYFNIISSLFGIFFYSIILKKKSFFYIGKLNGIFADIKNIKVL